MVRNSSRLRLILQSVEEIREGRDIPPTVQNEDALDYLPDRIRVTSIVSPEIVILQTSQIIPRGSLLITSVDSEKGILVLERKPALITLRQNIPPDQRTVHISESDQFELGPITIRLEQKK
jgi:hypothetical protein